ncbi:carbohydrate binding domain-containing protein [Pseudoalteromonas sp. S16_S37]|uniref:carbohydrate binding domain-containing protein n=1 Tax=Pseudoalteromonas sp. S16_S37 TaxID=2720228 RepID=UPI001680C558|nr:carbohydrate binding domain-containing protein [Pseudoalteromonas sp. S16_S37]MBD1583736.1 hypothetical protein [Pseudoalteromonas sp. S16_S37]
MKCIFKLGLLPACFVASSYVSAHYDSQQWNAKFDLISNQYQAQYSKGFIDSASLAWAESYYLDALIEMYQATGDSQYLDVFNQRASMVINNSKDDAGLGLDGYKGWSTNRYSNDGVENIGAELVDSGDATLPKGWHRWQSSSLTAYRNTAEKVSGQAGFTVKTAPPSGGWQVLQTPLVNLYKASKEYDSNRRYHYSFTAKIENCDSAVKGQFQVYDFTTKKILATTDVDSTQYHTYQGEFVTPVNNAHDVQVRLYASEHIKQCTVHFDDINVKAAAEYVVHDGMIAAPLAKFVKLARLNKMPERYYNDALTYYDFLTAQLFPKWQKDLKPTLSGYRVYRFADDSSSRKPAQSLPHNQYLAIQRAYAELSQIPNIDQEYVGLARDLILSFKSQLKQAPYTDANGNPSYRYQWSYWNMLMANDTIADGFDWTSSEDTSHGNLDIAAAVSSYHAGIGFDEQEMGYFANTAKFMISDCGSFSLRVNNCYSKAPNNSLRWWMQLAQFSPYIHHSARTILEGDFDSIVGVSQRYYMGAIAQLLKGYIVYAQEFDNPAEQTLPSGWRYWQSNPKTALLSNQAAHSGSMGLIVKNDPSYGWQVALKEFAYEPNAKYRLSVMGRVFSGQANGRVMIYDATAKKVIANSVFSATDWQHVTLKFDAPQSADHTLQIYLYSSNWKVDAEIHFDDLEIYRVQ